MFGYRGARARFVIGNAVGATASTASAAIAAAVTAVATATAAAAVNAGVVNVADSLICYERVGSQTLR